MLFPSPPVNSFVNLCIIPRAEFILRREEDTLNKSSLYYVTNYYCFEINNEQRIEADAIFVFDSNDGKWKELNQMDLDNTIKI